MPQFSKQSSRPLTTAGVLARTKRMRALLDLIERHATADDVRAAQQLTRAIHGLSFAARNLSERHRDR